MDHPHTTPLTRTIWTWQSIISNIYRLLAWVYLRWLPVSPLHIVVPALFLLYIPVWAKEQVPDEGPAPVKIVDITEKHDGSIANGFVVKRAGPKPLSAPIRMMFSLPSKSGYIRAAHFIINLAILAMTMDFTLHKYLYTYDDLRFAKLGATTSDSVKILVRYPGLEADGGALKLLWREKPVSERAAGIWKDGPIIHLNADKDWVGVVELKKLWPASEYEYRLAFPNSTFLEYPASPLAFKTFPDQRLTGGTHFSFIASSGITPNFPYLPSKEPNRLFGLDLLADQIFPRCCAPSLLERIFFKTVPITPEQASQTSIPAPEAPVDPLPTGILVDPKALKVQAEPADPLPEEPAQVAEAFENFHVPTTTNKPAPVASSNALPRKSLVPSFVFLTGDLVDYSLPYPLKPFESLNTLYRRIYASSSFRKIYERIPVFNILNEVAPNVEGTNDAYTLYSGQSNYNAPSPTPENWYDFRYGDVAFFVMDTKSHRVVDPSAEESEHTLLGQKQFCALLDWAAKVNRTATFKFIVSPIALSNMWGSTATEATWGLFASERSRVVDVLRYIPNVIVISGDRHEFAAIRYLEEEGGFWEFSSGPMSSFAIPSSLTKLHSLKSKVLNVLVNETLTKPLTIVNSVTLENGTETVEEVPVLGVDGVPVNETVLVQKTDHIREEKIKASYHGGNYKWTRFEVDTTNPDKPTVKVELSIDGSTTWSSTIEGRPVPIVTSSALGIAITGGLKGVLEKIGLNSFGKLFKPKQF